MKKIILPAIFILVIFLTGCTLPLSKDIGQEEAKKKTLEFVKNNLVQPGTEVAVKEITKEGDLYKIVLGVGKQEITSYLTQDGKKFFPEAMDMEEVEKSVTGEKNKEKEVPKSDIPEVELFVMSYCPYGTQIEKGILPVLGTLKEKIRFTLKFVDYAMHDKKELDENLRQYCIQRNEPEKLSAYLFCFLKKGQGTEVDCMKGAQVDLARASSCVADTDLKFNVSKNYGDKATWSGNFPPFNVDKESGEKFGVTGSPTLVVNGTVVKPNRDSKSLLKVICESFNNAPEECKSELSGEVPGAGFGESTGSTAGGSCAN